LAIAGRLDALVSNLHGKREHPQHGNGGGLDFEAQLWAAADKMRGHMDASKYVWD
jgi:hypothetical protein